MLISGITHGSQRLIYATPGHVPGWARSAAPPPELGGGDASDQ